MSRSNKGTLIIGVILMVIILPLLIIGMNSSTEAQQTTIFIAFIALSVGMLANATLKYIENNNVGGTIYLLVGIFVGVSIILI
ncbi:hypothetical protein DH09_00855 (plasmid) [Bacillaceae bacterium JMAK1]|nr:hypothetical protein DH09_00855 [Bacillaceae bacterium JMAK1]